MITHFSFATRRGKVLSFTTQRTLTELQQDKVAYPLYSGGFDPLHEGHIACIQEAVARYGHVGIIANSDQFLIRKRQTSPHMAAPLLPLYTRLSTLAALTGVAFVVEAIDADQTVCETIAALADVTWIRPSHFVNGGDRTLGTVPEELVCADLGIEMVWGCGGDMKLQESSVIAERAAAIGALTSYDYAATRWGSYCTVAERSGAKHKLLQINAGTGLSIQTHQHRSETWRCLEGRGRLALGLLDEERQQVFHDDLPVVGQICELRPGVRAQIACGQAHAVYAESELIVSEWQYGDYLKEDDINRYGDPYHRPEDRAMCENWLRALEGTYSSAIAAQ